MIEEFEPYEIDTLRWHRDKSRKESDNADRMDSQICLARLGYLTRSDDGRFSITTKGLKLLASHS